ncbi:MAG: DUF4240 domain-containing protein [Hamadaea sp.]|uniref:DUF4240 domain-containing protein n=1 Tax=Hamadaea sp. TaxID=2024425 RepID=UPI00183A78E7|nr:DUF4240 domain-containing protein [Hamadaea sp.]NUT20444.1 DUF4240 domain-containing protein [Hamadaea sp.]
MELADFWALIDQARTEATTKSSWATAHDVGNALKQILAEWTPEQIIAFDDQFARMSGLADEWELCAACFLISGYLSDDGFTDFRAGIVGLGRTDFEQVIADSESIAELPIVRGIAEGSVSPFRVTQGVDLSRRLVCL